jgi:hypothetical protein
VVIAVIDAIPQHASTLSIGIGLVLAWFGLSTGLLHARPEPRRCPSCGVRLRNRTCRQCRRA